MTTQPLTRRVKVFSIPDYQVLDLFVRGMWPTLRQVAVLDTRRLPDGVRVVGVQHDFHRQAFVFLLEHPSFDEVAEGAMAPDAIPWGEMLYRLVEVAVPDDADVPVVAGAK